MRQVEGHKTFPGRGGAHQGPSGEEDVPHSRKWKAACAAGHKVGGKDKDGVTETGGENRRLCGPC